MYSHEPAYFEWLKGLTEGEEVAYDSSPSYSRSPWWRIATITKITPTGQYRLSNNDLVNNKGRRKSEDNSYYIMPVTDEIRETIRREKLLSAIRNAKWETLPTDVLEHINTWLLFGEGEKPNATVS